MVYKGIPDECAALGSRGDPLEAVRSPVGAARARRQGRRGRGEEGGGGRRDGEVKRKQEREAEKAEAGSLLGRESASACYSVTSCVSEC